MSSTAVHSAAAGPSASAASASQPQSQPAPAEHTNALPAGLPALPDWSQLITVSDIKQALAQVAQRSSALDRALGSRIEQSRAAIASSEQRVRGLAPQLELIHDEISVLDSRLQGTADRAEKVSKRIRSLDEEKKRLAVARQWALDASELKVSCLLAEQIRHAADALFHSDL